MNHTKTNYPKEERDYIPFTLVVVIIMLLMALAIQPPITRDRGIHLPSCEKYGYEGHSAITMVRKTKVLRIQCIGEYEE